MCVKLLSKAYSTRFQTKIKSSCNKHMQFNFPVDLRMGFLNNKLGDRCTLLVNSFTYKPEICAVMS